MAKLRCLFACGLALGAVAMSCGFDSQPSGIGVVAEAPSKPATDRLPNSSRGPVDDEPPPAKPTAPEEPDEPAAGSPDGDLTSCPSCDDEDACTQDSVASRSSSCRCTYTPIVDAIDADGCCPAGATEVEDLDCGGMAAAACGNGRIDAGEECDGGPRCGVDCKPLFLASLAHRYSFDGEGRVATDTIARADGRVVRAMLEGSGALSLPGGSSNAHVELPAGLISRFRSATIEVWVTPSRDGEAGARIFDVGNQGVGGEPSSYWALTDHSMLDGYPMALLNLTALPDSLLGDQSVSGRRSLTTTRAQCVAVVFDDAAREQLLYVDGQLLGSGRVTGRLSDLDDAHFYIGRSQYDDYPYFTGSISEFRIYGAALSRAELMASFSAGPDPGRP